MEATKEEIMNHKPATALPNLLAGLSETDMSLTPMCNACGWRKGGLDSWDGQSCKCGHSSLTFRDLLRELGEAP
jgi:hypothetical protein